MTDRINASTLSEQDGDRLRDLLARFAERARETKEVYEQGRGERVDPGILAIRRVRWKACAAAYDLMVRSFHWSTVPSTVPPEVQQRPVVGTRGSAVELPALMARIREQTRGTTGVDDELRQLRGGDP